MSSLSSSSSSFSDRFLFCSSVSFFSPLNRNCYWVWKWMVLHRGCQKVLNDNIGLVFIRPRLMSLCLVGGVMVLVLVVRLQMNIWSLSSRGRRSRTAREALTLLRISTRPLMKQKNDTNASQLKSISFSKFNKMQTSNKNPTGTKWEFSKILKNSNGLFFYIREILTSL